MLLVENMRFVKTAEQTGEKRNSLCYKAKVVTRIFYDMKTKYPETEDSKISFLKRKKGL
jgi:hypothetical protein